MTRILVVETASPKRVRQMAEQILTSGTYSAPEVTILCSRNRGAVDYFREVPGAGVIALGRDGMRVLLGDLNRRSYDVLYAFWTGEKKYRRMKLFALGVRSRITYIDSGDGGMFLLTWKTLLRHAFFRRRHPLPTDHHDFVSSFDPQRRAEERVLIVQSAEPSYVLRALDRMKEQPNFRKPCYTIFCRNRPEVVRHFQNHPMVHKVITHSEARGSLQHWRNLRRERFDGIVLFLTGDPSYWKVKYFAFSLGVRHILIFNEAIDCFFFTLDRWLALMSQRVMDRSHPAGPRGVSSARIMAFLFLKLLILPFRFLWLLLVWLRLRVAGLGLSS